MFIRVKTTPNSPRKSVRIVESFREGKKVRQRIVPHVGVATAALKGAGPVTVSAVHVRETARRPRARTPCSGFC